MAEGVAQTGEKTIMEKLAYLEQMGESKIEESKVEE